MLTIDLNKTSSNRLRGILADAVGANDTGRIENLKGKQGVGGFIFSDMVNEEVVHYRVNLELFPSGLGAYCRSATNNYLILFPFSEIQHIRVHKKPDLVRLQSFSWYRLFMKMGFSYEKVRFLILESEWVRNYPLEVFFQLKDNVTFSLYMKKARFSKAEAFFSRIKEKVSLDTDIKSFEIIQDEY
jgi:hypothetical protein